MSISGNFVGSYSQIGKTFTLVDESGNEVTGVVVDQETVFTATDNDVREGLVYASDSGVSTGTKDIPAYYTCEGKKLIPVGSNLEFVLDLADMYDYTRLQCIVCLFDTSLSKSVCAEKVVIDDSVYNVNTTDAISTVIKNSNNKSINFGIVNTGSVPYVLRFFTYREVL